MIISTLSDGDKPAIIDHLLRLPPQDRYTRFFVTLSEDLVRKYVMERVNPAKDGAFGVYEGERLVAFVHISNVDGEGSRRSAELGISIDEDQRGRHIARALMQRALVRCKAENITLLFMSCLSQNVKMQQLAKSCGMRVVSEHGEAIADLQLEQFPLGRHACLRQETLYETISLFDMTFRYNSQLVKALFSPVYG
jgi:RimJ/RimL family protein N-acetyltransferase